MPFCATVQYEILLISNLDEILINDAPSYLSTVPFPLKSSNTGATVVLYDRYFVQSFLASFKRDTKGYRGRGRMPY